MQLTSSRSRWIRSTNLAVAGRQEEESGRPRMQIPPLHAFALIPCPGVLYKVRSTAMGRRALMPFDDQHSLVCIPSSPVHPYFLPPHFLTRFFFLEKNAARFNWTSVFVAEKTPGPTTFLHLFSKTTTSGQGSGVQCY